MAKTGRNDPCPCGSGKKFKKCCLRETSAPYVSVVDRMAESFKEVHSEWKLFLVDEDCPPEDFESMWPDAVNDALLEEWVAWDDLLVAPTEDLKEKYHLKRKESHKKWEGDISSRGR